MKRILLGLMLVLSVLGMAGCGGDDHGDRRTVVEMLSDETVDGYITDLAVSPIPVVNIGAATLLAGIDPISDDEHRAFLDFPLGPVPVGAIIESATLEILVRSFFSSASSIPVRIDLVDFEPPLIGTDFDRSILLPLASISVPILSTDVNRFVTIDVTSLMVEAQRRRLPSFQVRILEDFGVVIPGRFEIDDSSTDTAPLLTVSYF